MSNPIYLWRISIDLIFVVFVTVKGVRLWTFRLIKHSTKILSFIYFFSIWFYFLNKVCFSVRVGFSLVAIFLLLFQLFVALTEQAPERRRSKWLIFMFLLLSLYMVLQGCTSRKESIEDRPSDSSSLIEGGTDTIEKDSIAQHQNIVSITFPWQ